MSPSRVPTPARLVAAPLLRLQSDERLVALIRDGHEPAFSAIVGRYGGALERYAARIVGETRAEDAVQQAFVNAHRALLRDDRPIELKAWLYRITHNAALNQLRSVRDEVTLTPDEGPGEDASSVALTAAVAGAADVAELRARLRETLDRIAALPAPQRDALLLRELEGRSHQEIALALGISAGAARQQVARARTALRAAATAITPYPLLTKMAVAASGASATTAGTAEIVGGFGAGAAVLKLTAGIAATGALVSTVAVPALRPDAPRPGRDGSPARVAAATAPGAAGAAAVPAVLTAAATRAGDTSRSVSNRRVGGVDTGRRRTAADGDRRRDDERRDGDRSDDRKRDGSDDHRGPASATDDDRPETEQHASGSGSRPSSDDDDRPSTASSSSGSGSDDAPDDAEDHSTSDAGSSGSDSGSDGSDDGADGFSSNSGSDSDDSASSASPEPRPDDDGSPDAADDVRIAPELDD